ncbi:MAG: DHH family phosphoesterase [Euryarchaeota archaeon]|nr:DHH family phosphoesterase [Euryarchaeota archaeon]
MDGAVQLPTDFFSRIARGASEIDRHREIRVLTHYDADGIASAGVLCNALLRSGKRFHATMAKSLDSKVIAEVGAEVGGGCIILADMGSSYLKELEALSANVVVLDHHSPQGDSGKVIHVNPHLFGVDGMVGASASALCQLLAVNMNEANWDLLPIAFGGIVGDRQHIRGLSGVNRYLLDGGIARGIVESQPGSIIPEGKVMDSLVLSIDPYIVGLSGEEKAVGEFMSEIGIEPGALMADLGEGERRKLASLLALRLLNQGCSLSTLEDLVQERYYFKSWKLYASDFASLLNACGRSDKEGLGLGLALGDPKALDEAMELRKRYKRTVLESLRNVEKRGLTKTTNIQYFHSDNPSLSGMVCGLTMQYMGDRDKPTIALSVGEKETRISSRATFEILDMGVDLAVALRDGASAVGGFGGGHAIASGATIPRGREEEFMKKLDSLIGEQKAKRATAG